MGDEDCHSYLLCLPCEILEIIVSDDSISIKDALSLSSTCRQLRTAVLGSQNIWKAKYSLTWPYSTSHVGQGDEVSNDWLESCKYIKHVDRKVLKLLQKMSDTTFWRHIGISTSDFNKISKLALEKETVSYTSVIECLMDICDRSTKEVIDSGYPYTGKYTLTNRYFAKLAIEHLRHIRLESTWNEICQNPITATPEKVATFFSQWINTLTVYRYSDVHSQIKECVDRIKDTLGRRHPIHNVPPELQENWANGYLTGNHWEATVCHNILQDLSAALFRRFEYKINPGPILLTFFLDKVIENRTGNIILMTVLYEAVARRLGVHCNIVCFSSHLFITWQDSFEQNTPIYYVDIESGTLRGSRGRCPYSNSEVARESYRKYSPVSLVGFMAKQYQCIGREDFEVRSKEVTCAELLSVIRPNDQDCLLNLAEAYENHNRYVDNAYWRLSTLFETFPHAGDPNGFHHHPVLKYLEGKMSGMDYMQRKTVQVKPHLPKVSYAIGMICFHREFQYTCVIRGWDPTCSATPQWQAQMQVFSLSKGSTQPFYHCLAEDGSERYVAQENLTAVLAERKRLSSIEDMIGHQFSHFDGFSYVPNSQMEIEYPEDGSVRRFFKEKVCGSASFNKNASKPH